ncbi:MAG TPA: PQQ-dependent sugar dehydrogenase [Gemmatimonadales bacterium]|nr:PQQ-dependent sugar dehydrogenase [Gemmatimonadales bacterium]
MHRSLRVIAVLAALGWPFVPSPLAGQTPKRETPTRLETQTGPVAVERLASLEHPWGMAYLPDGRLLVTEKPGRLRLFGDGKLSPPVAGVPEVVFRGQGGLLDVAVDPDFERNRYVYLSYAEAAEPQPPDARETGDPRFAGFLDTTDVLVRGAAVARARLDGERLTGLRVIWRQVPKTVGRGHYGGRLAFGPDGKLYITSGDRMRFDPAQDRAGNLGKVVRIDPDGSIPSDNPFAGRAGVRGDIWTLGHRNPLGIAFEPGTGRLWIHEMGPLGGDEVNLLQPGGNYGWPVVSNGDNYDGSPIPDHGTSKEFALPLHGWTPVVSPSGLAFYTGHLFPGWRGGMLLGGLSSESLIRLTFREGRPANEERIHVGKRIRDVIEAPDGAVLVLTDGPEGELLRLTPLASVTQAARSARADRAGRSERRRARQGQGPVVATVNGLRGPEAVRYDPDQDVYFVANFDGDPTAADNNGFISRVRPDGTVDRLRFIAGGANGVTLHAPRGMFIAGDTLWAVDLGAVRGFHRRTGRPLATIDFSALEPGFLNDIARGPDGALYVTDTPKNRIYRIAGGKPTVALEDSALGRPNGIAWDRSANRFLVVPFGGKRALLGWRPGDRRPEEAAAPPGGRYDGVEVLGDGRIVVTSQADSSLYVVTAGRARRVARTDGAPADIGLDTKRMRVAVPFIALDRVDIIRLR